MSRHAIMAVWLAGAAAGLVLAPAARAQISEPTAEDIQTVPPAFRPEARTSPDFKGFAPRGTPAGYTPSADPRDITASYVKGSNGGPGGPGDPRRGGGPPGAPPVGGRGAAGATARQSTCIPSFGGGDYPTHVVTSAGRITIVSEENHRIRRVYLDAQHPAKVVPAYGGDSVGHWEGDTLVIDTIQIKGRPGVHLLERWTRQKNGSLDIVTSTLDAAGNVASSQNSQLVWRPDVSFVEDICEDFGEAFGPGYGPKRN
jgi:hypothetical protein